MKRFVLRWAVLFIAANLFGFVVHGLLLQGDYAASPQLLHTARRESALRVHAHRIRPEHADLPFELAPTCS
jgi:hypothetical protein